MLDEDFKIQVSKDIGFIKATIVEYKDAINGKIQLNRHLVLALYLIVFSAGGILLTAWLR